MPELRWLHSPDVDLEAFEGEIGTAWGFLLQIGIAPPDVDGEDSFDLVVCSPEWIAFHYGVDAVVDGRCHLLISRFSLSALRRFVERSLAASAAPTWDGVVEKFGAVAMFSS